MVFFLYVAYVFTVSCSNHWVIGNFTHIYLDSHLIALPVTVCLCKCIVEIAGIW